MTLNQAIERLRRDLGDTDVANAMWTEADLARHLTHALADLSRELPRQMKSILTTTANSRDLSVATLAGRLAIVAVEWPAGEYPPHYVRWSLWQDSLTLLVPGAPAAAENVAVYWHTPHLLDPAGTTVPDDATDLLIQGALGYAAQEASSRAINAANTGGPAVPDRYAALGATALQAFRAELKRRSALGSLRTRVLYGADAPIRSQSTDPGP